MSNVDLECRIERFAGCNVVRVSGEIDLATWKPFGLTVYKAARECAMVIVDLDGVTHFDACGANALRTVQQLRPDVALTVRNPPKMIAMVLDVAGLGAMSAQGAGAPLAGGDVIDLVESRTDR